MVKNFLRTYHEVKCIPILSPYADSGISLICYRGISDLNAYNQKMVVYLIDFLCTSSWVVNPAPMFLFVGGILYFDLP
jgi:hypothetical protein